MRLIVVNKTLDRAFDNLLILLRNTIFALQRIGRWCGFFHPGLTILFYLFQNSFSVATSFHMNLFGMGRCFMMYTNFEKNWTG